ncbi:nitroreductase family protein [Burkholderia cepacia]|uniref:nitroreductase family protein n=1 Tax=Burkholderia cepacia TaxID=292 RepID=UPI002AB64B32|nr:nitroreductase family protein [Burkholderia cepacia]
MTNSFINSIKNRRSQYILGKNLPMSENEVSALIQEAIKLSPSAFNSQSSRAIILFGAQSDKFWGIVKEELRKLVPSDSFSATEQKIDSFAAGAGTVLFYEDYATVTELQKQYSLYAENFPVWSEQGNGMAQFSVWAALADANIGASLQHYNPLPDAAVAKEWGVPTTWKLRAQMPFGQNKAEFSDKTYLNDNDRFRVFA